jgi:transposase InsO family protein
MEELRSNGRYKIGVLCKALGLSRSGYHAWKRRKPSLRKLEEERIVAAIKAAHERGRGTYGPEKIQTEILAVDGLEVGLNRIKRLRRKHGIRCKQKRKFKATTDSRHKMPVALNLLSQKFEVLKPNQVWVADITYIPTDEGWLYLAGIKDLCTKEIVGYALNERMTHDLVGRALFRAVAAKKPPRGLIHHSDRGSQYCSRNYQKIIKQFGINPSMSRKGNCYDNAPMESWFGTLKSELTHHRHYRTRQEAVREIVEYIEIFYNRQRRHANLGNISPAEYVRKLYILNQAA